MQLDWNKYRAVAQYRYIQYIILKYSSFIVLVLYIQYMFSIFTKYNIFTVHKFD